MSGWELPNGTWVGNGDIDGKGCGVAFKKRTHLKPCLFDLLNDEREMHDLSSKNPAMVKEMMAELNRADLTAYLSRSPTALKGACDANCANAHWTKLYGSKIS